MRLGPEFVGKLPPGAQDMLDRSLASWRESGVVAFVQLVPPGDCPSSDPLDGMLFPIDRPPNLPIAGCSRKPCCGCDFVPILDDEDGTFARPTAPRLR